MPPRFIDLRKTDDTRDVVHLAVQALAEGRAVGFPTETDYVVAVSGRHAEATAAVAERAVRRPAEPRLSLILKSGDEALDWAPRLSSIGQRIIRRCWPGPVAVLVPDDHPESLVHRLPPEARGAIVGGGRLRLRVPGHAMIFECMRMLAGPVAVAEPVDAEGHAVVTAEACAAAGGDSLALVLDDGRSRYAQPPSTIEAESHGFRMVRPGVVAEETIRRLSSLLVLFVCTGNTCRSPMAEAIFRDLVAQRFGCSPEEVESRGVLVASAGIAAWAGGRASEHAVEVMREMGIDLSEHASQPLTEDLVHQADVIWTMTAAHRAALLAQFPEAAGRVEVLAPDRRDVLDPIGGPRSTYRECARQIHDSIAARIATLDLGPSNL